MTKENKGLGGGRERALQKGWLYSACAMKDLVSKVPSEECFGLLGILFHLAAPSAA